MGAEREATAAEGLVVPFDVFAADTGDPAGARPERAERVPPRAPTGAEDEALVGAREVRAVDVPGCAAVEVAGSLRGSFLWDLTEANWVAKPSPMRPTARSTWPPASPRTRRRSSSVQSGKTAWSWRSSAGYWARTARAAALSSAGGRVEGPAEPAPRVPRVRRARPPRGRASAAGELEGCAEEDAAGAAGAGVSVGGAGMAEQTRAVGSRATCRTDEVVGRRQKKRTGYADWMLQAGRSTLSRRPPLVGTPAAARICRLSARHTGAEPAPAARRPPPRRACRLPVATRPHQRPALGRCLARRETALLPSGRVRTRLAFPLQPYFWLCRLPGQAVRTALARAVQGPVPRPGGAPLTLRWGVRRQTSNARRQTSDTRSYRCFERLDCDPLVTTGLLLIRAHQPIPSPTHALTSPSAQRARAEVRPTHAAPPQHSRLPWSMSYQHQNCDAPRRRATSPPTSTPAI